MAINYRSKRDREKEYERLLKNLKSKVRYYGKKGYIPDEELTSYERVSSPKKADIIALASLNKAARSHFVFLDFSTGELRGTPDTPIADYTALVDWSNETIELYRSGYSHFPTYAEPRLNAWLDSIIEEYGVQGVAAMLVKGYQSGLILTYEIAYDDSLLGRYMNDHLKYIGMDKETRNSILNETYSSGEDIY